MGELIIVFRKLPNPGGASDGGEDKWRQGSETADTGAFSTKVQKNTAVEELVQIPSYHSCAQSESCRSRDCLNIRLITFTCTCTHAFVM